VKTKLEVGIQRGQNQTSMRDIVNSSACTKVFSILLLWNPRQWPRIQAVIGHQLFPAAINCSHARRHRTCLFLTSLRCSEKETRSWNTAGSNQTSMREIFTRSHIKMFSICRRTKVFSIRRRSKVFSILLLYHPRQWPRIQAVIYHQLLPAAASNC
jgi:hypothetical protein